MELTVFTFALLIAYILIGYHKVKKLEMEQKKLLWRIESMEKSLLRGEPVH